MKNIGIIVFSDQQVCPQHMELLKLNNLFEISSVKIVDGVETQFDAFLFLYSEKKDVDELCKLILEIRAKSAAFIWILSNELTQTERLIYLQLGADGVFDRNISPIEFSMVILNSLKRNYCEVKPSKQELSKSTNRKKSYFLKLNSKNRSVFVNDGVEINLTKSEYRVLELLYKNKGEMVTYEEIAKNIWGGNKKNDKFLVCNLIHHLRKKMSLDSNKYNYIKTIRSSGYMLCN